MSDEYYFNELICVFPFLQLELYKTDFEEERRVKELLKEEKEKLIEDLQCLQRRNQQLQDRIEMICDKDFVMYQERTDHSRPARSSTSAPTVRFTFVYACVCLYLYFFFI